MTLIVPTSNVSFSLGSNITASDPTMGKSLDDMIKDRRKEQAQASKRGPKKVDNADRAIATNRAKRAAAVKARRGLSDSKKPTPMEVEQEVYREARKTAVATERKQQKAAGGRLPPDSSARRQRKKSEAKKTGSAKEQQQVVTAVNGRPPSKKVVKAAVSAMREKGFEVPDGMKVVISFQPTADLTKEPAKKTDGAPGNKKGGKGNNNGNGNNNQQKSPSNKNTPNKNNGGGRRKN